MTDPVASPCVRICCLDDENVCLGCGRTLDDIRRWSQMSDTEKRATNEHAHARCARRQARFTETAR